MRTSSAFLFTISAVTAPLSSGFTLSPSAVSCSSSTALWSTTEAKPPAESTPPPAAEVPVASVKAPADAAVAVAAAPTEGAPAETKPADAKPAAPPSNQPKYGVSMDLPDTYVRCGNCASSFAIKAEDLGEGKGRRVECSLCHHSWFQTRDRLFTLNDGHELVPLPESDTKRIALNLEKGREADFKGNLKFYVGNLSFGATQDDVRELFQEVGDVGDVALICGEDGRSKGFAFVTMMDDDVQDKCIALDGKELKGRNINVKPPNN